MRATVDLFCGCAVLSRCAVLFRYAVLLRRAVLKCGWDAVETVLGRGCGAFKTWLVCGWCAAGT